MQGFTGAGAFFRRWLSQMRNEMIRDINVVDRGTPGGGSDEMSFVCHGVPAFSLNSQGWDYEAYTWHTNRDTFDKLVFDDLKYNAMLVATLAYLASEDPQRVLRERATTIDPKTGKPTPGQLYPTRTELGAAQAMNSPDCEDGP
jgi:carboxypeptidase Q